MAPDVRHGEVPLELARLAWEDTLWTTKHAGVERLGLASPDAVEREKGRYVAGQLELDEFELRVDGILHGAVWWEQ